MRSLRTVAVLLCLALVSTAVSAVPAYAATDPAGTYTPLAATRLLDTRKPIGVPTAGKLGPGKSLELQVAGQGGVPKVGVSAVVINLTVTEATGPYSSYLAAYPAGGVRPGVSSINFVPGVPLANIATVPLGAGGKITIYNSTGSVSVLADVMGYYAASNLSSATPGQRTEFDAVDPQRLVDTRSDPEGPLAAKDILMTYVDFYAGNNDVRALALNITATAGQSSGYLTAWDGAGNPPKTSTLNYRPGTTIANMAVVQTTRCSGCSTPEPVQFGVYNDSTKSVGVIVDMVGVYYYDGTTVSLRFSPVPPVRISDSRKGMNGSPLTANQTQTVTAPSSVLGTNTVALVTNTAVINPSYGTYLTLWKAGDPKPGVSNLNAAKGTTAANGAFPGLSSAKQFNLFNLAGTANFIVDVTGRFDKVAQPAGAQRQSTKSPDFNSAQVVRQRSEAAPR